MKYLLLFISTLPVLFSCTSQQGPAKAAKEDSMTVKQSFFPVTSYIRGQVYEMKRSGINPVKYITSKNHTDSVWLKVEDIDEAVKEFLTPEIDSNNLVSFFTERNFLDQSIAAYTFTYDPSKNELPDSIQLRHWDVYIDQGSNKVKRVYIVKEINKSTMLQLIWQSGTYCKITTIVSDENGNTSVAGEVKINWDF